MSNEITDAAKQALANDIYAESQAGHVSRDEYSDRFLGESLREIEHAGWWQLVIRVDSAEKKKLRVIFDTLVDKALSSPNFVFEGLSSLQYDVSAKTLEELGSLYIDEVYHDINRFVDDLVEGREYIQKMLEWQHPGGPFPKTPEAFLRYANYPRSFLQAATDILNGGHTFPKEFLAHWHDKHLAHADREATLCKIMGNDLGAVAAFKTVWMSRYLRKYLERGGNKNLVILGALHLGQIAAHMSADYSDPRAIHSKIVNKQRARSGHSKKGAKSELKSVLRGVMSEIEWAKPKDVIEALRDGGLIETVSGDLGISGFHVHPDSESIENERDEVHYTSKGRERSLNLKTLRKYIREISKENSCETP